VIDEVADPALHDLVGQDGDEFLEVSGLSSLRHSLLVLY
jgi:hypothetical protein